MSKKNKKIYIGMCADFIHAGHINIINIALKFGDDLIIGLLTNGAVSSYKNKPIMSYKMRKLIIQNIKGVTRVIPQKTLDYSQNLIKLKPDYVIHGDDWKSGVQSETRQKVIKLLKTWNGKLVEVPYTQGISSTLLKKKYLNTKLNNNYDFKFLLI